jgi:hypothetical protein
VKFFGKIATGRYQGSPIAGRAMKEEAFIIVFQIVCHVVESD